MKDIFKVGDIRRFQVRVKEADTAKFEDAQVHPVYSTFALARDAEWACRLFVLEMKEDHEEGIGTMIRIDHQSPAKIGDEVYFEAKIMSLRRNEIICRFEARVSDRLIAKGEQGQKIINKQKLKELFESL